MKFHGTIANHRGRRFAIVEVAFGILQSQSESAEALRFLERLFPDMPIVLMASDPRGELRYRGPEDLAHSAQDLPTSNLQWREYETN